MKPAIAEVRPAPPGPAASIWWLLHMVQAAGGSIDASDTPHNPLNAFCGDCTPTDTFNQAVEAGYLRVSHNSDFDTSSAWITEAGREHWLAGGQSPEWRCFHCDEVFTDRRKAEDHFGLDELETPACVAILTEGERAIVEDRRMWRERAFAAEAEAERDGQAASALKWDAYRITKKYGGGNDSLWLAFEHVEGRMLAAEAALSAGPRWVASWLRRRAERRWQRARKAVAS